MSAGRRYSAAELSAMFCGVTEFEVLLARATDRRAAPGDLAASRAAGRAAYERAFERRGVPPAHVRAAIFASALPWLYGGPGNG